jgi:hypothetical protein
MRKHILGFALFALIISSAIFAYRLFYSPVKVRVMTPKETPRVYHEPSTPVIKPEGFTQDFYAISPASVVVDVNSRKLYAGIGDKVTSPATNEFVKVVIFTENSDKVAFQTRWMNYMESTNLVFSCDECAAMTSKTNYYARLYFAGAPDDANLKLRLKNEKSGDYNLQPTSVLVNSGKN